jgi:hypothetical protein
MAMMAMTTSSSIKVKARRFAGRLLQAAFGRAGECFMRGLQRLFSSGPLADRSWLP